MDAITLIGASGAVAGLIQSVNSAVNSLYTLYARWKDADFLLLNMVAQLTALKAALIKIHEWMLSETEDVHYQLTLDLESSVKCCQLLIGRIDLKLSELDLRENASLDAASKVKIAIGGKSLEEVQKMLDRQISALNLLLTACNCTTISQQSAVLSKSSTKKMMEKIKDDSSSLYVHRDTASILSYCTDGLSKLSLIFAFDKELLGTNIYQRVLRGSVKEALRRRQTIKVHREIIKVSKKIANIKVSKEIANIDSKIEEFLRKERLYKVKVLLAGEHNTKQIFLSDMLENCGKTSEEIAHQWRGRVRCLSACRLERFMENLEKSYLRPQRVDFDSVYDLCGMLYEYDYVKLDSSLSEAVKRVLNDGEKMFGKEGIGKLGITDLDYRLQQCLEKAVDSSYYPTDSDCRQACSDIPGTHSPGQIDEHHHKCGELDYIFINFAGDWPQQYEKRRILHYFEDVSVIFFVVDLECYNQPRQEDSNGIEAALKSFEVLVSSPWFRKKWVGLIFIGWDGFSKKLSMSPLRQYLPEFKGNNDAHDSFRYILDLFKSLNTSQTCQIYSQICELGSEKAMRFVHYTMNDAIILSHLEEFT